MYSGAPTAAHGFVPWDPHAQTGPVHFSEVDDDGFGITPDPRAWEAMPSLPPIERQEWPEAEIPEWLQTLVLVAASAACSFAVGACSAVVFFVLGVVVA